MTLEEAKKAVKEKFGFDENTMLYLEMYRYGEALIRRLAEGGNAPFCINYVV